MGDLTGLRDYEAWLSSYDDPGSSLSWRLRQVQTWLRDELDARPGPLHVLSACAGDGRDVLEVLAGRPDADRVRAVLLELHPGIARGAQDRVTAAGLHGIEVRTVDAGETSAYVAAVPADVVLLVGVFGNISDDDLSRTIAAAPALCRPGALLIWSRGRKGEDLNDRVRAEFAAAGFRETGYVELDEGGRPALGAARYAGPVVDLVPGQRLFTFRR